MKYTIMYKNMDFTDVQLWEFTQYGLFSLHYHDGKPSSVDDEMPIWRWYSDLDQLREELKLYEIDECKPKDYFKVLESIHEWTKPLHKI